MRTTKAVMIAGIATFLAGGFAQAGTEARQSAAQPARTPVQKHTAADSRAQADRVFQAVKVGKSCTYRGGPKTGNWDCR